MPGKVKVKIVAGRNLPVMDRSNDTTDAYVEVKLGSTTFKTDVCRKSLNPQWNSEWFRFEMDDLELQDEPLQIRLMDHDTYSANDAIGKVYLDLNPLLLTSSKGKDSSGKLISGWIPVYDTMHGIRGEVNLVVKVELFSDLNKFRQSSCGVMFFFTQAVPDGFFAHSIHGFVEELVVNDDPEYQWIDKIRTPRASNEARQTLFSKLSGEVQRRVGLKALELGGNAVIGYRQCFDLEGESGIVVRGIGTAATLTKQYESQLSPSGHDVTGVLREFQSVDDGLLLPYSSHPSKLSKSSRSKRTGSRVPTSTHSMPATMLLHNDTNISLISNNSAPPTTPISFQSTLSYPKPLLHDSNTSFRMNSSACSLFSDAENLPNERHPRGDTVPDAVANKYNNACDPFLGAVKNDGSSSLVSSENKSASSLQGDTVDYGDVDQEVIVKVKFHTGAGSLSSLSGVENENKLNVDADVEDEEDEDERKVKIKENHFSLLLPRKPRGSKKKERYSKNSLLKRASMNFADSKRVLGGSKGKEKFTDEIVRFFKKKSFFLSDKDDTSSLSENPISPYRQPKSSLFRRRQKFHGTLHRCNSESFSLGQTSLDSLPSVQSELVFDPEDDTDLNSVESLPHNYTTSSIPPVETSRDNACTKEEEYSLPLSSLDGNNIIKRDEIVVLECVTPKNLEAPDAESEVKPWLDGSVHGKNFADPESTAFVVSAMKKLGYGMEKPLKLYISSADALLIYEPLNVKSNDKTDTTNLTLASNSNEQYNSELPQHPVTTVGSSSISRNKTIDNICRSHNIPRNSSSTRTTLFESTNLADDTETENMQFYLPSKAESHRSSLSQVENSSAPSKIILVDSTCSMTSNSTSISILTNNSSSSSGLGFGGQSDSTSSFRHSPPISRLNHPRGFIPGPIGRGPLAGLYNHNSSNYCRHSYHSRSFSDSSYGMTCKPTISVPLPKHSVPINTSNTEDDHELSIFNKSSLIVTAVSGIGQCDGNAGVHGDLKDENGPCSRRSPIPEEISEKSRSPRNNFTNTTGAAVSSTTISANTSSSTTTTTTTNTHKTTTATVTNSIINVSLSSNTNASSTNLPPAPLVMVSKSTASTNVTNSSVGIHRQQNVSGTPTGTESGTIPLKPVAHSANKVSTTVSFINRRSSESDLSTPFKPISTNATTVTTVLASSSHGKTLTFAPVPHRRLITADHFEMLEYPFITLNQLPPGFIQHLGGTVSARSVKLLERISNLDEPESRDSWWNEIRMEIRSHARSIGCNVVLGYEEHTTMCDDVCVLSASGTAAVVSATTGSENCEVASSNVIKVPVTDGTPCACPRIEKDKSQTARTDHSNNHQNGCAKCATKLRHTSSESSESNCGLCHIPYNESSVPFPVKMTRCLLCKKGKVPDILLATVDLPNGLQTYGKSCLIQAQVFRPKKDCKGEISAKEVSDSLPFLEYELHRRLINKLKVRGMNAIFALQVQICLGDKLMVGLATGTAVFVSCLPAPSVPKISAGNLKTDSQKVIQFQKVVQEVYERNREVYNLKNTVPSQAANGNTSISSEGEESDEDLPDIDLATGNKDTYVLEVDDAEDIDIIQVLIDPSPELGFYMNNINFLHGFENYRVTSQQMFTQVWRCRISPLITLRQFTNYFDKLLQAVAFKLRRISPCVLSKLRYRVELPEQDEMQLSIIGLAVKLDETIKTSSVDDGQNKKIPKSASDNEIPSNPESEPTDTGNQKLTPTVPSSTNSSASCVVNAPDSGGSYLNAASGSSFTNSAAPPSASGSTNSFNPGFNFHSTKPVVYPRTVQVLSRPKCIEITPLSHIPGGKIEKYLGNLNFFFIRETTSIRESGGLSGFVHSFIAEVLAIVRAHVAALGGNAMVSYFMTELALLHNPHKNQGQCLVNVGGDCVVIGMLDQVK